MNNEFLKNIKFPKFSFALAGKMFFWAVTLAAAVTAFFYVRDFTACWNLTGLPGIAPANCGASEAAEQFNPEGTPIAPDEIAALPTPVVSAPELDLPPSWDGASRINMLFIGLDYADWREGEGPPRSDTMDGGTGHRRSRSLLCPDRFSNLR